MHITDFSCLETKVYHHRHHPSIHSFTHEVLFLLLDIEQESKVYKSWFFSYNKFNIFSVNLKDYNMQEIRKTLEKFQLTKEHMPKILLLTMPKFFGYAFNPVSFFLCFNQAEQLCAVLVEVHNTFKERHTYLCFHEHFTPILPSDILQKEKVLHVSPFCQVEGYYKFRFAIIKKTVNIDIDYYINNNRLISTSIKGSRRPYEAKIFFKYFFLNLWAPFKVIFLIHYHALCLWYKKIPYFKKPPNTPNNIS